MFSLQLQQPVGKDKYRGFSGRFRVEKAGTEQHIGNEEHWFQGMKNTLETENTFLEETHRESKKRSKKAILSVHRKPGFLGESLVCSEGLPSTTWDKRKT